jgi:hypothetical protein
MGPPTNLDDLSDAELRALAGALLGQVTELKQVVSAGRDEITRLQALPTIKPKAVHEGRKGRSKKPTPRVAVEDRILAPDVPEGSRFKGYQDFVVQDLVIRRS